MKSTLRVAALLATVAWCLPASSPVRAAPACRAVPGSLLTLPGRVDSILAAGGSGNVFVLVGRPGSQLPYIPHDSLLLLGPNGQPNRTQPAPLPAYVMPPGLAAAPDGTKIYVLADSNILTIASLTGRTLARQDLAMQAIGAPAALTTDAAGDLFLIGQPADVWDAQAYAFSPDRKGVLQQRWRMPLGPTHAGSWVGNLGNGLVAVYTPDQHDQHGTIALLSQSDGTLRGSYQLVMPPAGLDADRNLLYLAAAGAVRAVQLRTGSTVAMVPGGSPLAVDEATGNVAYVRDGAIEIARGNDLQRDLLTIPFSRSEAPTALAWSGSRLLVGTARGLGSVILDGS